MPPRATSLALVRAAALLLVALCLVPAGAHLSELPNKIGLPADQYMLVQQIYRGWALFGSLIVAALAATALQALLLRHDRGGFRLSLFALLCLVAAQALFWLFTFPINVASANWSKMPEDFEAKRRQWEYSHAAGAVLTGAAFLALILSLSKAARPEAPPQATLAVAHAARRPARGLPAASPRGLFIVGSGDEFGVFLRTALEG